MSNLIVYLVGGAVRDKLLGKYVNECDWVVVGARENDMLLMNFYKVGKDFPVFIHPIDKEEYALARLETKIGLGYYGFSCDTFNITLEKDLHRRDLTINSLALDFTGKLIDPFFGNNDLYNRLLKHVSLSFKEDPVRILRIARFYVKFFNLLFFISIDTYKLVKEISISNDIKTLVNNRIWKEIICVLKYNFTFKFFELLYYFGILKYIFYDYYIFYGLSLKFNIYINILNKFKIVLKTIIYFTICPHIKFVIILYYLRYIYIYKFKNHGNIFKYKKYYLSSIYNYKKYCIPNNYMILYLYIMKFSFFYYRLYKLKPLYIFHILNIIKAFKKKKQFINILLICEINMIFELNIIKLSYAYKYLIFDIIDTINNNRFLFKNENMNGMKFKFIYLQYKLNVIDKCVKKYISYFN